MTPDFIIEKKGVISKECRKRQLYSFTEAARYIQHIPYGRNIDKGDPLCVFKDGSGTCSTKHAFLLTLATEQQFAGLQLIMGLFKMNARNTPKIASILQQYNLPYIPEAHCYLKFNGCILDYTTITPIDFKPDLLEEQEIHTVDILEYKLAYHKGYMQRWLRENPFLLFTSGELWQIREDCIKVLST